jgi:uncharacterized protein (TIGR03067 family)
MKIRVVSVAIIFLLVSTFIYLTSFLTEEKIDGKWRLREMAGEFDFCPDPGKAGWPEMTFIDGNFAFEYPYVRDGNPRKTGVTGTYTCDNSKNPKQITFAFGGQRVVAIYKISLAGLQICVGESDHEPPTKFRGGPSARPALLKFQPIKD